MTVERRGAPFLSLYRNLMTNNSTLCNKIAFQDVAECTTTEGHVTLLKTGMLFVSTPIDRATSADTTLLRETHRLKTNVTSDAWKYKRHITDGRTTGVYVPELFAVENVLGLYSVKVNLRGNAYLKNINRSLPPSVRKRFEADARKTNSIKDPSMLQRARDNVWNRDSIDDIFLVLLSSAVTIGRFLNEVLAKEAMYPLVISGDRAMRDNTLIVFLLLLMLDIPFSSMDRAYLQMTNGLPKDLGDADDVDWRDRLQRAGWGENRSIWTREMCGRKLSMVVRRSCLLPWV